MKDWWPLLKWMIACLIGFAGWILVLIGTISYFSTEAHTINHLEAETTINLGFVLILISNDMRR